MLKNKNESMKISNFFFIVMGTISIFSIVSLLIKGESGVKGYSEGDYYFNLIMMIIYSIASIIILLLTNKKNIFYKDEFPVSRRLFNLFVLTSIMSMVITLSSNILSYIYYGNFSWYSLYVVIIGYVPAYFVAYKKVQKGSLLSIQNQTKTNVTNFIIIYMLMQYYINIIAILSQMILKMGEITELLSALCMASIWLVVVIIAYKLLNKK